MKVVRGVLYEKALSGLEKGIIGIWYNSGLLAGGIRHRIYPNFPLRHIHEV
jgi:hypothetical protein